MKTVISKWENSLGLFVPPEIAEKLGLKEGSAVEIFTEDNKIIIKPSYYLEQLLAQVTEENIHTETETGEALGLEIW